MPVASRSLHGGPTDTHLYDWAPWKARSLGFLHITRGPGPIDPANAEYRIVFAPLGGRLELPRFRGWCTAFVLRDDGMPLFIADRRQIVQTGMPPVRVVPALDEIEDGHPGLGLGREAAPV